MTLFFLRHFCVCHLIKHILLVFLFPYWLFFLSLLCWLPLLFHAVFHSSCINIMLDWSIVSLVNLETVFLRPRFPLRLLVRVIHKWNLHGISDVELKQSHYSLKNFRTRYGDEKTKKWRAGSSLCLFTSIPSPVRLPDLWFCWLALVPGTPSDTWL